MSRSKKLDTEQIISLAKLGATVKEIATFMHVSDTTINEKYLEFVNEGRVAMKMSLRRAQWKSALEGNVVMQIFLGKNILDQADSKTVTFNAREDKAEAQAKFVGEMAKIIADMKEKGNHDKPN
jgi:hypothetical protein